MKIRYSASVLDSVHGEVVVKDGATPDDIDAAIYEDIKLYPIEELDWDVTDTEEIK